MANITVKTLVDKLLTSDATASGSIQDHKTALTNLGAVVTGGVATGLNMSTAKILGRTTAITGAVEEITVGSGLSFASGVLDKAATTVAGPTTADPNAIARFDANTGKLLKNSLVTVSDTGAITAPSVGSLIPFNWAGPSTSPSTALFPAATTSHGAIVHSHADAAMYYAHTPTGGPASWVKMLDASVGSIKTVNNNSLLGNGDVTISASVADLSITTAKLANSSSTTTGVTTAKIADGAVTSAKLAAPTLFLTTAPVNGKLRFLNLNNLLPDGAYSVATPYLYYDVAASTTTWATEGFAPYTTVDAGWVLTKDTATSWLLEYHENFSPLGSWTGVGAGENPASSTIVWTPVEPALGTPLFTASQTSGSTVGKVGQVLHSTISNGVFRYECISEFPYTWQLDSTVTISHTTPTNPILGMEWFDLRSTQSIFYDGISWIGTKYDENIKKEGYTKALAAHMVQQIDSRLDGKNATTDMQLFTGLSSNSTATTFTRNSSCWLDSLRSQLCGFHMQNGVYRQNSALIPLGGRFFLSLTSGAPFSGSVTWPKSDGTTFTTTIERNFVDASPRIVTYMSICITADAAPPTLSVIPIVKLDINREIMNSLNPPMVYISQGGASSSAAGNQLTTQNRKCAVMPFRGSDNYSAEENLLRYPFGHGTENSDTGCPKYLLINNKLYLYGLKFGDGGQLGYSNGISYLQDLVNRAASAHEITPIKITTVTNPTLPLA